jgi:eukaryotic-like serine/threonine-protein kinase
MADYALIDRAYFTWELTMSPDPKSPEMIFGEAIAIESREARADFLDQVCKDDPDLQRELEQLVTDHFRAGDFLENPAVPHFTFDQPPAEQPGTMIGSYKLIEDIGAGGMGTVFMALQKEPVRRKVALKVIKPGLDSKQVVGRFEAERQALAMMDHPNIARVFDGGSTESGRPYFVMELVNGMPVTDYCDRYRLATHERLELFGDVCSAVQHAHQRGIIHRDLKPSNILVTRLDGRAVPKVIDFGIAKATSGHLTDESLVTHFSQMIGSPLYMSPEQAELSGADVDVRTDVYALGVLLYELLTGNTPFDPERMSSVSFDEFRRIIREEEPPRPSTCLSTLDAALDTVAGKHHTEPCILSHEVAGELDWIVMKALEKDRTRRYGSANELAKDVERYLADEPVEARPPSVTYQLCKFMRRNRWPLVVAAAMLLLLLSGIAGTTTGWIRATQAEAEARSDAALEAQARQNAERERRQAKMLLARIQFEQGVRSLNRQDQRGLLNLVDAWSVSDEDPELQIAIGRLWAIGHDTWADRLVQVIEGGDSVAISPDGKLLATAKDRTAKMWDLATGQPHGRPLQLEEPISTVLFSPDGKRLAVHSAAGETRLWETQTHMPIGSVLRDDSTHETQDIMHPASFRWSAAFSNDGKLLATGAIDGVVRLWDPATGQPRGQLRGHEKTVMSVTISPDGKLLASGSKDGTVRLWVLATKQPYGAPLPHSSGSWESKIAFSPDGQLLAVLNVDNRVDLWKTKTLKLYKQLGPPSWNHDLAFSPDGKRVAVGVVDWMLQLWDTDSGRILGAQMHHCGRVKAVAFSPDGKLLASGSVDQTARLWNTATGEPHGPLFYSVGTVSHVVFSPDGKFLAAAGNDTRIWRIDSQTDRSLPEEPNNRSIMSPDGRFRATITEGKTVELVDTVVGTTVNDWFRHGRIKMLAFSPDSRLLATGSDKWSAKIWEPATGQLRQTLECPERVYAVAFSPDGKILATGLLDGTVLLWDFAAGRRIGLPLRHQAPVWDVAFSPDGKLLASISGMEADNSCVWFWDVTTGPKFLGLRVPYLPVSRHGTLSSFSLDGKLNVGGTNETNPGWSLPQPPRALHKMQLRSWIALGLQQDLLGQATAV